MDRVLVTGGAGYLGSILVPALLDRGFEVTVLDSFMYGQPSLAASCHHPRFRLVRGDARVRTNIDPLLKDADIVIPLAALVGAPLCDRDPYAAATTNRDAIVDMLPHLGKDQRVVMPVSNSGYGIGQPGKFCTEESPLRPVSLYGRLKVEAERALLDGHAQSVSLRLATVFGMSPRMRFDLLVNDFTFRAWRDRFIVVFEGHFKRNYIHVRDVARAFIHVLDNFASMGGQIYNVGLSDANLSKLELCARIQRQVPDLVCLESAIHEDPDKRDYVVSNEKIERTGFAPAHSLDAGIAEVLKACPMFPKSPQGNI
jgi:nucleoside-diphosphate-sugar epimerase